jgi:FixJ family two-component response regulator
LTPSSGQLSAIRRSASSSLSSTLVAKLTPRERQVFGLVVQGRQNGQIAYELGIAVRTVKAHRAGVMAKTKAETTADLVLIAERLGMR